MFGDDQSMSHDDVMKRRAGIVFVQLKMVSVDFFVYMES